MAKSPASRDQAGKITLENGSPSPKAVSPLPSPFTCRNWKRDGLVEMSWLYKICARDSAAEQSSKAVTRENLSNSVIFMGVGFFTAIFVLHP
jgi:hypothetical protein